MSLPMGMPPHAPEPKDKGFKGRNKKYYNWLMWHYEKGNDISELDYAEFKRRGLDVPYYKRKRQLTSQQIADAEAKRRRDG